MPESNAKERSMMMPATPMYVELLVIGLSASVWLGLFLCWLFGGNWITESLTNLQYFSLLISALAVSFAYALGILMDKLSKYVLEKIEGEEKGYFDQYAALLRSRNELAIADLTYVRSKVRILRASVFNFPLVAIFLDAYLWTHPDDIAGTPLPLGFILVAIFAAGGILTVLSFLMYRYNSRLYQRRLNSLYEGEGPVAS